MTLGWLQKSANGYLVLLIFTGWLLYALWLFNGGPYGAVAGISDGPLLEETFAYSQSLAQQKLEALGDQGRSTYRQFQVFDGIGAVLMAAAFTLVLAFVFKKGLWASRSYMRVLILIPVLAGLMELAENSLLFSMASKFPGEISILAAVGGPITSAKLIIGFASMITVVICVGTFGISTLVSRIRN